MTAVNAGGGTLFMDVYQISLGLLENEEYFFVMVAFI